MVSPETDIMLCVTLVHSVSLGLLQIANHLLTTLGLHKGNVTSAEAPRL